MVGAKREDFFLKSQIFESLLIDILKNQFGLSFLLLLCGVDMFCFLFLGINNINCLEFVFLFS